MSTIVKLDGLLQQMRGVWSSNRSRDEKLTTLASILSRYDPGEIEAKILGTLIAKDDELAAAIKTGLSDSLRHIHILVKEILEEPLQQIRQERARYRRGTEEQRFRVGLRAVKGPAFCLWALNAGVCVASDVQLWQNPDFFPGD